MRPAPDILERVQRMAPNDPVRQRALMLRWAGLLGAHDPEEAAALRAWFPAYMRRSCNGRILAQERAEDESPLTFEIRQRERSGALCA